LIIYTVSTGKSDGNFPKKFPPILRCRFYTNRAEGVLQFSYLNSFANIKQGAPGWGHGTKSVIITIITIISRIQPKNYSS
jgi:hypothetical protein